MKRIRENITERQRIRRIFAHVCGCGNEEKWSILLAMLERAEQRSQEPGTMKVESFYDPLRVGDVEIPGIAVEFIAHALDDWGLFGHGSSIGGSWLEDDGRLALKFLREFGVDSDNWPPYWCSAPLSEDW